jgi:hypothetical protein
MKIHRQAHEYSTVYYVKTLAVATLQIIDVSGDKTTMTEEKPAYLERNLF